MKKEEYVDLSSWSRADENLLNSVEIAVIDLRFAGAFTKGRSYRGKFCSRVLKPKSARLLDSFVALPHAPSWEPFVRITVLAFCFSFCWFHLLVGFKAVARAHGARFLAVTTNFWGERRGITRTNSQPCGTTSKRNEGRAWNIWGAAATVNFYQKLTTRRLFFYKKI